MWRGASYSNGCYILLVLKKYTIEYLCLFIKIKHAVFCCVLDFFYTLKEKHCRSPPPVDSLKKRIDWRKKNMQYEVDSYKLEYIEETKQYFICFKDSAGQDCRIEIQKEIYDTYMLSRKQYKKIQNQYDRHEEQSKLSDITLYKRALNKSPNVEDEVIDNITKEQLVMAKKQLTRTQLRRIKLHIEDNMTLKEIAIIEGVRKNKIDKSITMGMKKLRKFFKVGGQNAQ